jgi:hypothetical protein
MAESDGSGAGSAAGSGEAAVESAPQGLPARLWDKRVERSLGPGVGIGGYTDWGKRGCGAALAPPTLPVGLVGRADRNEELLASGFAIYEHPQGGVAVRGSGRDADIELVDTH